MRVDDARVRCTRRVVIPRLEILKPSPGGTPRGIASEVYVWGAGWAWWCVYVS
jgi:hypothetical protein